MTQFTSGDVDKLGVICQVAEQIELVAAMNVSDFSIQKQIQLQAMQITGAQVKENICDWVRLAGRNQGALVIPVSSAYTFLIILLSPVLLGGHELENQHSLPPLCHTCGVKRGYNIYKHLQTQFEPHALS